VKKKTREIIRWVFGGLVLFVIIFGVSHLKKNDLTQEPFKEWRSLTESDMYLLPKTPISLEILLKDTVIVMQETQKDSLGTSWVLFKTNNDRMPSVYLAFVKPYRKIPVGKQIEVVVIYSKSSFLDDQSQTFHVKN